MRKTLVLVAADTALRGVLGLSELGALACAAVLGDPAPFAVASVGGDETLLREAAAFGAGRALLLEPDQEVPTLQAAAPMAEMIRSEGFRLVVLGDGGDGPLLASALAGELGWDAVVGAESVREEEGTLTIERTTPGWHEVIRAGLPLVVTVRSAGQELRAPLEGQLAAAAMRIQHFDLRSGTIPLDAPALRLEAAAMAQAAEPPTGTSPIERLASISGQARASAPEPEPLAPRDAATVIISAVRRALGR